RQLLVALRLHELEVGQARTERAQAEPGEPAHQDRAPVEDALALVDLLEEEEGLCHPASGTSRPRLRISRSAGWRTDRGPAWRETARPRGSGPASSAHRAW